MNKKMITGNKNWLKVGAAALLSVGMLAACGDGDDDDVDLDVNNPPVEEVDPNDGPDTDIDVDTDDTNDDMDNDLDETPDDDLGDDDVNS